MAFLEVLQAAIVLNIGFFIDLFLGNLFWFFLFYTAMHYFIGKKQLYFALLFSAVMWAWTDLEFFSGLTWVVPSFLLIYYVTKLAVVALVETTPSLRKYVVVISTLQFYVLFLVYNFLLR